jgi:hypothetical protein
LDWTSCSSNLAFGTRLHLELVLENLGISLRQEIRREETDTIRSAALHIHYLIAR